MPMRTEKVRNTFCCVDCVWLSNSHIRKEASFLTISLNKELSEHSCPKFEGVWRDGKFFWMPQRLDPTSLSNIKEWSSAYTCLYLLKEHIYEYQGASANQWLKGTIGDSSWKYAELLREKWLLDQRSVINQEHCTSNKL